MPLAGLLAHLQPEAAGQLRSKQDAASAALQEKTAKIGYVDLSSSSDPVRGICTCA